MNNKKRLKLAERVAERIQRGTPVYRLLREQEAIDDLCKNKISVAGALADHPRAGDATRHYQSVAQRTARSAVLAITLLFVFVAVGHTGELFPIGVQKQIFHKVGQMLPYAKYVENPPRLIRAEDLTDQEFADAVGLDVSIFGDKRGNFYSWRLDAVLLATEFADIDSLAHEYVHFYQYYFLCNKDVTFFNQDVAEFEAVRIQNHFR